MVLSEFVKLALVELAVLLLLDLLHYTNQLTPEQSLLNVETCHNNTRELSVVVNGFAISNKQNLAHPLSMHS